MPFKKEGRHPQASPRRSRIDRQGFLPHLQAPPPTRTGAIPPSCRPQARATTVLDPTTPPSCEYHHEVERTGAKSIQRQGWRHRSQTGGDRLHRSHAGGRAPSTAALCRPDAAAEAYQATRARPGPSRARKAPAAALLHAGNLAATHYHPDAPPPPPESYAAAQQPPARPDPDGTRRAQIWAWRAPPASATATPRRQRRRRRPTPAAARAGPSPDSTTCAAPAPRRSCSRRGIAPGPPRAEPGAARRRRRRRRGGRDSWEEGGGAAGRPRRGRAGREREGGAPDVDFPNSNFSRVKFKPIADDQTISAVFFNPEVVKPIPRLLDNVVVPDKTVTESDIPKRPLWHTYRGSRPPPVTCKPETLWKASTPAVPREEVKNAGTGWIGRGGGSAAAATVVAERRQIGRSSYGKGRDDGEMLPHRSGGSGYGRGFRGVAPAQSRSGRLDGGASSSPPGGSWVGGGGAVQTPSRPVGTWARGGGRGGRGQPRA